MSKGTNWYFHVRIHNKIRQIHYSSRQLSESEVMRVPEYAWVDDYFVDSENSFESWRKQYEKQSALRSEIRERVEGLPVHECNGGTEFILDYIEKADVIQAIEGGKSE